MSKRILIVEDDQDINDLLVFHLKKEGYEVSSLFKGDEAVEYVFKIKPNLIILDVMLPGVDGLDICRHLKSEAALKSIPILMLTAKSEESDQVVGLQLGADDYMVKPFSPKILVARVKALLRRGQVVQSEAALQKRDFNGLVIELDKHKVTYLGEPIVLTQIEFDILEFLSRAPGRVYSREQILDGVWKDGKFIVDRAVDVHVTGLRKKMGKAMDYIETVRGIGYRFKE